MSRQNADDLVQGDITTEQLEALVAVVRQGNNLSRAASDLGISQSGLSRRVLKLEKALGAKILIRSGRHIVGLTSTGEAAHRYALRVMSQISALRSIGVAAHRKSKGSVTVATTQTLAAHALPEHVSSFLALNPSSSLRILQGEPLRLAQLLRSGVADAAVATDLFSSFSDFNVQFIYRWTHSLLASASHPVFENPPRTLAELVDLPLITYDFGLQRGGNLAQELEYNGVWMTPVVTATDAEVIKSYVRSGVGIGIIASMAYHPQRDSDLRTISLTNLITPGLVGVVTNKGESFSVQLQSFLQSFAPHMSMGSSDASKDWVTYLQRDSFSKSDELFGHLPLLSNPATGVSI